MCRGLLRFECEGEVDCRRSGRGSANGLRGERIAGTFASELAIRLDRSARKRFMTPATPTHLTKLREFQVTATASHRDRPAFGLSHHRSSCKKSCKNGTKSETNLSTFSIFDTEVCNLLRLNVRVASFDFVYGFCRQQPVSPSKYPFEISMAFSGMWV